MDNGNYREKQVLLEMEDHEEHPILAAAREGDADQIRKLLREKTVEKDNDYVYPEDWKYNFNHLTSIKDNEGRTALHLAANIGDPDMSLDCVKALLESLQLLKDVKGGPGSLARYQDFVNIEDHRSETALHVAIENRSPDVVAYLLRTEAFVTRKNKDGVRALKLIYENVPDAMTHLYDRAVRFPPRGGNSAHSKKPTFKEVSIKWGAIFGYDQLMCSTDKINEEGPREGADPYSNLTPESSNLRYALKSEKWGAKILCHPLVRLYLDVKWQKLQWFFWLTFFLELFWLSLYPVAFAFLSIEMKPPGNSSSENSSTNVHSNEDENSGRGVHFFLWMLMGFLSIFWAVKELHKFSLLRSAYSGFESFARLIFMPLLWAQCILLWLGMSEVVFALGVIGVVTSTILVILQLGKTPCWGTQVAAWKKVLYSFMPHLPVFLIWFASFGLIFWAILFKADEEWAVGMVAIMAAMGTGELNAQDHVEHKEGVEDVTFWREITRAFALLFFAILIGTLYLNLLIGHAVADIQILEQKAKALALSNKLRTIYTLESILISRPGRLLVRLCFYIRRSVGLSENYEHPMDSIFVIPPSEYDIRKGRTVMPLCEISPSLRNLLSKLAYENKSRTEKVAKEMLTKKDELLGRKPESVLHHLQYVSAAFTSDGKLVRVLFDPLNLNLDRNQ